jgi:hypothetical protein
MDGLFAMLVIWGGALLGAAVGVLYFVKAGREASLSVRLLTSAFGPSVALLFIVASLWWPEHLRYKPAGVQAYSWLQVLPLLLLGLALAKYPGPRRIHWIAVPLGLLAWAWVFAWGWLFVHGE